MHMKGGKSVESYNKTRVRQDKVYKNEKKINVRRNYDPNKTSAYVSATEEIYQKHERWRLEVSDIKCLETYEVKGLEKCEIRMS